MGFSSGGEVTTHLWLSVVQVLSIEPQNAKALFRRAQAYLGNHRAGLAKADLLTARRFHPANKAILRALHHLKNGGQI